MQKIADDYPYRFYGPLHQTGLLTEGWNILAKMDFETEGLLRMWLTAEGRLLTLNSGIHGIFMDGWKKSVRETTETEKTSINQIVEGFSANHSAARSYLAPLEGLDIICECSDIDEQFVHVWAQSGEEKAGEHLEKYGDEYVVGIMSNKIYYFRSYVYR